MSRLRNRIRKADYFSDGELLRWPRDKRVTYSGLWALAEDSGCLEDDSFEWKMSLWPSPLDADITVEKLEEWRDELIEAGKLIPYEAEGKRYLFIRTFHQHERPTNPQRPDLPLPPWVRAEVSEGRSKDGKKWSRCSMTVSTDLMPARNAVSTESVQTQHARISRSPVLSCPDLSFNPPLPPQPVENEEDKSGGVSEKTTKPRHPRHNPTCDGAPCRIREARLGAGTRNRLARIVGPDEVGNIYNAETRLGASMCDALGAMCAFSWSLSAAAGREEREPVCYACAQKMVDRWLAFHDKKPIGSLAVWLSRRLKNATELADLCGEEAVEMLRALEHSGGDATSEPERVGAVLGRASSCRKLPPDESAGGDDGA